MDSNLDIRQIMEFLPHRYPFILVDRVLSLEPRQKIVALKNVTINEPFFQGHFPGVPIMPGVLILEALGQAGGVLVFSSKIVEEPGSLIYFTGIDKARFRKLVVPGDQIILELEMVKLRTKVVKMAGRAMVDDQMVAEAEFLAAVGENS